MWQVLPISVLHTDSQGSDKSSISLPTPALTCILYEGAQQDSAALRRNLFRRSMTAAAPVQSSRRRSQEESQACNCP